MMCTCLESRRHSSQDDPVRLSINSNQKSCLAEHGPAPRQEHFSVELENNELLAKARARNRLAQRRHRQKIKAQSNGSIERNQAGLGGVQKRPRSQSIGMHQQMGHGSSETAKDYEPILKNDSGGHRCPDIPSNAHTSQGPSPQVVDPSSIDLGSWTPSEDVEAFISSGTSGSTASSLDRDKNARELPQENFVALYNSPFSTIDTGKVDQLCRDTTQHLQHTHPEYTYGFEAPAHIFGQGNDVPSTNNNERASVRNTDGTEYVPTTYDSYTIPAQTSVLPYTTSVSQTKELNPRRRFSQTTNPYPSNALPTPPLCTPLQSSNPPSTLLDPPFPHCTIHPPSTPVSTSTRFNVSQINPLHTGTTPHTLPDQLTRLTHLLDLIDAHGFESLDALAITYYTTSFPAGHPLRTAQSLSRRRYLRQLLGAIQESAKEWGEDEGRGWREGVLGGVGDILGEEVSGLRVASGVSDNEEKARERLVRRLEGVFGNEEGRDGMREWKRVVRERATETWSLLTELGNATAVSGSGVRPGENAQIVAAFLCVLVGR